MPEYEFSLTRIFPYKESRIKDKDSVLIRENTVRKNSYSDIFYPVKSNKNNKKNNNNKQYI